jgi:hypothetical protein
LSFVLAIFGFGSLGLKIDILKPLIYLVPFVALCHDIYIFSEDYKVKRIDYFIKLLRNHNIEIDSIIFKNQLLYEIDDNISFIEGYWEIWVTYYREPYATYVSFVITLLASIGSAIIILIDIRANDKSYIFFLGWAVLVSISITIIFLIGKRLTFKKRKIEVEEELRKLKL